MLVPVFLFLLTAVVMNLKCWNMPIAKPFSPPSRPEIKKMKTIIGPPAFPTVPHQVE